MKSNIINDYYNKSIARITNLSIEKINELKKTEEGIKELIKQIATSMESNPQDTYFPLLGLLNLIQSLEDDEIIYTYIYNNDLIYNQIIDNQNNSNNHVAGAITSIIPIIKSNYLKACVFKKYKELYTIESSKYGKKPYNLQKTINLLFSFNSSEYIKEILRDETISFILDCDTYKSQSEILDEITHKKTDEEKRKCIIPEVLAYIEASHRAEPILSIESDSIKKEVMNDSKILSIIWNHDSYMGIEYHSYARICASFNDNQYKEELIKKGIADDTLDGTDLSIMISSLNSDIKKLNYLTDDRKSNKSKFDINDESTIIASCNEENADKTKYEYIYNKIIPEAQMLRESGLSNERIQRLYQKPLTNILYSMSNQIKIKCIYDEQIKKILEFYYICKVVISSEDDSVKFKFIKENIHTLTEEDNLFKELVLTMKTKYKKQCLEDEDIVSVLKANEKKSRGLNIVEIVESNYSFYKKHYTDEDKKEEILKKIPAEELQKEKEKEDIFKDEYIKNNMKELDKTDLLSITKSFNNQELKLKWVIYFAKEDIFDIDDIYEITEGIDRNKYTIEYDKDDIKPVSYKHK